MTNDEIIKFLQSKQMPQCGDKEYTTDEEYEAYQRAIDAVEQTTWIPVSEGLPKAQKNGDKDYSDWVQVTIDIGRNDDNNVYVCEAYYCFSENKWYTKRFVIGVVTAWMPLPEPYKGE